MPIPTFDTVLIPTSVCSKIPRMAIVAIPAAPLVAVTVTPDDPLAYALNKMYVGGFRNVPVVNDELFPVGIIGISDIISSIADYFHGDIINLPPLDKFVDTNTQEGG